MITKDEMKELMEIAANNLRNTSLTEDEIQGTLNLMKMDSVSKGIYKEEPQKDSR